MKSFEITLSLNAEIDINTYIDFIIYEYNAPITALRHYEGLFNTINGLKKTALSIPVCTQQSIIETYGYGSRRINFKKMCIIYRVYNETVIIMAVIPQASIKRL